MSGEPVRDLVTEAMTRLRWELRDLFLNALGYGNVGSEVDLARYLATGQHLTPAQEAVVVAAVNDALITVDDPLRITNDGTSW